jgi:hypothetical protein
MEESDIGQEKLQSIYSDYYVSDGRYKLPQNRSTVTEALERIACFMDAPGTLLYEGLSQRRIFFPRLTSEQKKFAERNEKLVSMLTPFFDKISRSHFLSFEDTLYPPAEAQIICGNLQTINAAMLKESGKYVRAAVVYKDGIQDYLVSTFGKKRLTNAQWMLVDRFMEGLETDCLYDYPLAEISYIYPRRIVTEPFERIIGGHISLLEKVSPYSERRMDNNGKNESPMRAAETEICRRAYKLVAERLECDSMDLDAVEALKGTRDDLAKILGHKIERKKRWKINIFGR